MSNIVIIGISDTADRIIRYINRYKLYNVVGCSVNKEYLPESKSFEVDGKAYPVWPLEDLFQYINKEKDFVFVAVFWNHLNADRKKLFVKVKNMGFRFANIISPHAIVRGNIVGENCWINDNVIIQEHAVIEDNVYVMDRAFVSHRSIIKNHAFIGVNAIIYGSVLIGEQCYVGINANVFDEVKIGHKCIIGACTYVKRNLSDCSVVKTPNDSFIIKQYPEDIIESKWVAHHNVR